MIKKALIEMRKDQYLIKQAYQRPIMFNKITRGSKFYTPLDDHSFMEGPEVNIKGISFMDQDVVMAVLSNYSKLKEDSWDNFSGDVWYLIQDFENLTDRALADSPILMRIVELKIDKKQNSEIQKILQEEFDTTYTVEYLSALWRNKIPKKIAEQAKEDYLFWYYTSHDYPMKRCTRCGKTKPAHNQFFSRNKTAADGWYSICKCCRNSNKKG